MLIYRTGFRYKVLKIGIITNRQKHDKVTDTATLSLRHKSTPSVNKTT